MILIDWHISLPVGRLLDSPHWVQIIEDSIPDSKDDVKSYHHEWINFAHSGLDWFASLGEFVPVANCLSILKSYATLLPASVCAVVARSSFLINTQEAENGVILHAYIQVLVIPYLPRVLFYFDDLCCTPDSYTYISSPSCVFKAWRSSACVVQIIPFTRNWRQLAPSVNIYKLFLSLSNWWKC